MSQQEKAKNLFSPLKGKIIFVVKISKFQSGDFVRSCFQKTFPILALNQNQGKIGVSGQLILNWFLRKLFWKSGNW